MAFDGISLFGTSRSQFSNKTTPVAGVREGGNRDVSSWPILLQKSAARCIRSADFFGSVVACGLDGRYKQRRHCGRAANATLTPLTQRTRRSDLEDETTVWRCGAGSGRWLRG